MRTRESRTAAILGPIVVLAALLALPSLTLADGLIVVQPPGPAPIHVPPGHPAFAPLEIRVHRVSVEIVGQHAVTRVDQVFYNPSGRRLEGHYLFPLPGGAQIRDFAMDVGGKMTEAELLDAKKAREIYEGIVRRMRDPALLEYAGQGLYKARIFPIEPHSEKRVRLSYSQLLSRDGGLVEYLYPLNTEKFSPTPLEDVSVSVELRSKGEIGAIYSPSHEIDVRRDGPRRARLSWEARDLRPETDFQLFFAPRQDDDLDLELLTYRDPGGGDAGFFLLLASPSTQLDDAMIARKDVVFVLDTSGSMAEDEKMTQARRALSFCVSSLNEGDRFEIVRFSTDAEALFSGLREVDEQSRTAARRFLEGLKPRGGTAIDAALQRALASFADAAEDSRSKAVVFLTDGLPTIGTTDEAKILSGMLDRRGERAVRVFVFGVGNDVNTHLLDKVARETRAASQYVRPREDIEVKVSAFYSKINDPVLTNPRLDVDRVRIFEMHPRALPDVFRGEQLVVFGRFRGTGDARVRLTGLVNGRERAINRSLSFRGDDANAFIARLWATRRVGYLLEQIRLSGESAELRDEVTRLARRYGIVTPYTAYLIVEDEAQREVPVARRTLQLIERDARVRRDAERIYREQNVVRSGDAAVAGSMSLDELKRARVEGAGKKASALSFKGQTGALAPNARRAADLFARQAVRHIRGRAFYQNGELWVDSQVAEHPGAKVVQIEFGSKEYFALMRQHPGAAAWLSVGRRVQLLLSGVIYVVTP